MCVPAEIGAVPRNNVFDCTGSIAQGLGDDGGDGSREGERHHSEGNSEAEEAHAGSILVGEVVAGWVAHSDRD